jgi:hypothetical protein
MLAPSKTRLGLPEVWSTRAGMRPLAGGLSVSYIDNRSRHLPVR